MAFSVMTQNPLKFCTFVFFVTFCSNALRSLLFHRSRPPLSLLPAFSVQIDDEHEDEED
jgi:hypothetical protein